MSKQEINARRPESRPSRENGRAGHSEIPDWTIDAAGRTYQIDRWGAPFFAINDRGNVAVRTREDGTSEIEILNVLEEIGERNIELPVLIRFQDLLQRRVVELNESFRSAIDEFEYGARYQGVYPVKVNQLHEVVLEILEAGEEYNYGLECGSKAELLAAMPHLDRDDMLLICNGYKDRAMQRLILGAQQIGKSVIPIVEKYSEFEAILAEASRLGVTPRFGVRARLSTAGSGRWAESAGDTSKFGVSIAEIVQMVLRLRSEGLTDSLQLVHFHIGSQVNDIMTLKSAVREGARVYSKLRKMGVDVQFLDVGGGLGVHYVSVDSGTNQTINYTLQEYVNGVVYSIKEICDIEEVPHPIIVSESGRAVTAHHSVLVVGVLESTRKDPPATMPEVTELDEPVNKELSDLHESLSVTIRETESDERERVARCLEIYHDTVEKRGEADTLFSLGYLSLEEKAKAEMLYWHTVYGLRAAIASVDSESLPTDLRHVNDLLVDQYLCDFSVFQSMLDYWAIGQIFPIMPIHRLNERPDRRGALVDLTCDSDGKIDRFVCEGGEQNYLPLHSISDQPYYLGCFLMGAYQDILGDMHNLFGRVNEVHIYADDDEPDNFYIEKTIPGSSITDVLSLVQYASSDLRNRMDSLLRQKVKQKVIRPKQGVEFLERYQTALREYTYYDYEIRPTNGKNDES